MKTEQEIKQKLKECREVFDFGMSKGPCPFSKDKEKGCCAECTTMQTLAWVLKKSGKPNMNGQHMLIDILHNMGAKEGEI